MAIPLHARVAGDLRDLIHGGSYPPGTPVPSEARLCEQFGVSRGTIRSALATLRHEGMISGGQGRPPVVRDTAAGQPFDTLMSFTAWSQQMGREPGQHTVEVARRGASAAAAEALGIPEGTAVVEVLRQRLLDGEPAMVERTTFIEAVGRLLFDYDPDAGSIFAHLASEGVDLHSARHTFDAVAADTTDADLLDVAPGTPLLRERRRTTSRDGVPLEYSDDRYRPDLVTFTIDNTRPASTGISHDLRVLKESS